MHGSEWEGVVVRRLSTPNNTGCPLNCRIGKPRVSKTPGWLVFDRGLCRCGWVGWLGPDRSKKRTGGVPVLLRLDFRLSVGYSF